MYVILTILWAEGKFQKLEATVPEYAHTDLMLGPDGPCFYIQEVI